MAGEALPGPVDRLVRTVVTGETSLRDALHQVAGMGCGLIHGCAAASITLIVDGRPTSVACTDDVAADLDAAQYDAQVGPCLLAIEETRTVRVDDPVDPSWPPELVKAASAAGISSSLSTPLVLGSETLGGLNLYGELPSSFDEEDEAALTMFASYASAVVANVNAYWDAKETTERLSAALASRAVIEQAKGILIARESMTADAAFDVLRRASQRENRKLRVIAQEIVHRAEHG